MTLGLIEGVLCMGIAGLIWMMLDHFAGDHSAKDTGQEPGALDHHGRMDQPGLRSPVQQKHEVLGSLPATLIERLGNAASWTGDPPLADLAAEAIEDIVTQMEEINGEVFLCASHLSSKRRWQGPMLQSTPIAHVFQDSLSSDTLRATSECGRSGEKTVQTIVG